MFLSKGRSGNYFLYFKKDDGKKTRVSTKTKLKKEALQFLKDFEIKTYELKNQKITIQEFSDKYLQQVSYSHTKESFEQTQYVVENFLKAINPEMYISKLQRQPIENYILSKYKTAPYHSHFILRHLKAYFNKAIEFGYLDTNPLKKLRLKVPTKNPMYIGMGDLNKILEKETDETFSAIYLVTFMTGLRNSEIVNLKWNAIDFERKILTVKNDDSFITKSKKDRIVPMNETVYETLEKIYDNNLNGNEYVFTKDGEPIRKMYLTHTFKKAVRLAELDDKIHFHSLRHSFASNLVQKNVNLLVIQKLLGHAQLSTTLIYSHLKADDLISAVKVLD